MANNTYHREIDGLRAVSVIVIILFHLDVTLFQGGAIGVDVFFVISGYLITRIIVTKLNAGQFTFKDFYIRRGARILPALLAIILLVLPLSMYLQQPGALVHTAQESISALFSLSNIYYWTESSYWAPAAEKYVLLHTWSLGVEEQFYLFYPLLLVIVHRVAGVNGVISLLVGIAILGAAASEATLNIDRSAAFYFTPLRFYEFAFGGLAAMLPCLNVFQKSSRVSGSITMAGLVLILYGCFSFNGSSPLPGILMLIPIIGAVLVLLAGPSPVAQIVLMNSVVGWIGKISYSLYLVHWPIIVFYRLYYGERLTASEQFLLFGFTLLAGALLNRTVERRYRLSHDGKSTASGLSSNAVLLGTASAGVLIVVVSTLLIVNEGWSSRMPVGTQALLKLSPVKDMQIRKKFLEENCTPQGEVFCGERQPDETNILLLGDSRALDIYIALKTAYPHVNIQASYAMGCAPVFSKEAGLSPFYPDCLQLNRDRLKAALEVPADDVIFLAQNFLDWRIDAILDTVVRLRNAGKTVYLFGEFEIVKQSSPVDIEIEALRFPERADHLERYLIQNPFSLDGEFAGKINASGAVYISYRPFFYDGQYHFTDRSSGKLLTLDGRHLNQFGAIRFGEYLRQNYPLPLR